MKDYQHTEAYCHMLYRSDDGSEEEWIWNSRDGVTPFVITLGSGKQATHVDWHRDRRDLLYKPKVGERIFVDMTIERKTDLCRQLLARYREHPDFSPDKVFPGMTEEEILEHLVADITPGEPDLIEVTS